MCDEKVCERKSKLALSFFQVAVCECETQHSVEDFEGEVEESMAKKLDKRMKQ